MRVCSIGDFYEEEELLLKLDLYQTTVSTMC